MKSEPMKKIRKFPNEEFREFQFEDKLKLRYAASNKGRVMSFVEDMNFGRILKGSMVDGYRVFKYKIQKDKVVTNKHFFIGKIIATLFLPKTSEEQLYVLHLDRVRDNDDVRNLQWATREEMLAYGKQSPHVINAKKRLLEHNIKSDGRKLTVTKVMVIKKILAKNDQKTRLKMIAKQFGVSEMQIRRIKSGENWGHIVI